MFRDSFEKIIVYFHAVTNKSFEYKGKIYKPKPLYLSTTLVRDFECFENCGGCCPRFSLDYLNNESKPEFVKERLINFNGKEFLIYSFLQKEQKENYFCDFVNKENGRCLNYLTRPFSCDFELIRVKQFKNKFFLGTTLFGRCWNMMKIDGTRGGLCKLKNENKKESLKKVTKKLLRLKEWCEYFDLKDNRINQILEIINTNFTKGVYIYPNNKLLDFIKKGEMI